MAAAAPASVRGRDRKKQQFEWKDVQKVQEFDDGWYVGYLGDPADLATLGRLQGHCSGTHFVWACEEKIWYFFALFDPDGVPHGTLHAKEKKWMGKDHPRDSAEVIPRKSAGREWCHDCRGNGGNYDRSNVFVRCERCKGNGYEPVQAKKDEKLVDVQASGGGMYPSYQDVVDAFKKAGLEYEPGKYRPLQYNSRTYEGNAAGDYYGGQRDFDYRYGDVFGGKKPEGISDELWAQYTKSFKALKDEFNKNNGFIKIAGRVFKFDGKNLIVLSFSDKDQYGDGKQAYRKKIAEFLNEHTKSKRVKKEVAA